MNSLFDNQVEEKDKIEKIFSDAEILKMIQVLRFQIDEKNSQILKQAQKLSLVYEKVCELEKKIENL